jgi:WS/DGAT/MGAT family acyltransferase
MLWWDRGSIYTHTLKIAIFDPSSDPDGWAFERYRALLADRLPSLLRKRYLPTPLGVHQPVWVDDPEFELDAHLRRVACPSPGGMVEFCSLVEQISSHPLDHDRPLWQIWVVEGLAGGRVAAVSLVHHAYSDGAGMRGILEEMTSSTPTPPVLAREPGWDRSSLPGWLRRLVWAVVDLPSLARDVPSAVTAVRERRRLERRFDAGGGSGMPRLSDRRVRQPFAVPLARTRRLACGSFSLERMRDVRGRLGGTVNDVFLCCVAGGVREFLGRRGSPPDEPMIGSMAFLTKPLSERSEPGGNFSAVDDLWLHVEIADPVERLAATRRSAQVTKDHFNAVAKSDPMLVLTNLLPGRLMRALRRFDERSEGRFTPGYNVVVSNVPGPEACLYFGPWRVEQWFSTAQLTPGITLNFTGWSYAGEFNLCVLSGSSRVPDAWELMEGFRASFDELLAAARAIPPVAATA